MKIIEAGKHYLTRDGHRVTIEQDTGRKGLWRFQGVTESGALTWYSAKGRHLRHPSPGDLVAEIDRPATEG